MNLHSQFFPQRGPNPPSMKVNTSLDVRAPYCALLEIYVPRTNPLLCFRMEAFDGLKTRRRPAWSEAPCRQAHPVVYSSPATFENDSLKPGASCAASRFPMHISCRLRVTMWQLPQRKTMQWTAPLPFFSLPPPFKHFHLYLTYFVALTISRILRV